MSDQRPNIVLITADQWRGDCLGGTSSRHPVMTPHLTQLACEGARFSHAYADCPVCMPQRVTQLTGQVASRFGLCTNFGCRSPIDPTQSLPGRLTRQGGYQSRAVGKMHFQPARARFGFEHIDLHPNDYVNWLEDHGHGGGYRGHGLGGNEVYPAVSAVPERFTHTHWVVDRSIEFLSRRDPDCPFFLWMVFEAPHSPFDPPEPFDRMYDRFEVPAALEGDWLAEQDPPGFARRRAMMKYDHITAEILAETRRRYYGQISHIDYQLGRFFGELMTLGLYGDTAIVFTADHGEHLGDHGLFAKQTFLSGSGDVPLIMRLPGGRPNQVVTTPALTADIAPTLLELAGLGPSPDCDGRSFLADLRDGRTHRERLICGEVNDTAFCSDGQYKYIYYQAGGVEQLFDTLNDPENLRNLIGRSDLAETTDTLRAALVDYLTAHDRPMAAGGKLQATEPGFDYDAARGYNPFAYRGPMRYGRGYGGYNQ